MLRCHAVAMYMAVLVTTGSASLQTVWKVRTVNENTRFPHNRIPRKWLPWHQMWISLGTTPRLGKSSYNIGMSLSNVLYRPRARPGLARQGIVT